MANRLKSFETVLEEERREVLAMIEKRPGRKPKAAGSSAKPRRASSPILKTQPPVRSMLDIGPNSGPASNSRTESPGQKETAPIRSMLDIESPVPAEVLEAMGTREPTEVSRKVGHSHHRSLSDTAYRPANLDLDSPESDFDPTTAYFTGFLPSSPRGPIAPKRNTQTWRKGLVSSSPRSSMITANSSKRVLSDGRLINKVTAHHRLSDTNLALLGTRSSLESERRLRRASSGDASRPNRSSVEKEDATAEDEEAVIESSEEDERSSDEERPRGRKKQSRGRIGPEGKPLSIRFSKGPKSALGRAAAAARDNLEDSQKQEYKVQSLLEPEITVTGPPGDKSKSSRHSIHPYTSFDEGASGLNTPVDSDAEADLTDIKRAQKLSVNMTSIVSTPATGRCVRTIYRGDFAKMQQEAHDNQRRVRKYLVATDLSEEAAHALEWTIGTVLRDGDTLLAIYCVDEELGISSNEPVIDDIQLQAQTAAVGTTKTSIAMPALPSVLTSPLSSAFKLESSSSANASPMGRGKGRAEQERFRAVQDITDRVSKLLRRTKLQVKVVIEVIHCKSPKHLITEVIDFLSPTLVILGSRGRSALKGVILGSFSNYLVTKSSVPVMVARKRLRKHSKYKRPAIRLANNLEANPAVRSLATAKID